MFSSGKISKCANVTIILRLKPTSENNFEGFILKFCVTVNKKDLVDKKKTTSASPKMNNNE